MLGTPHAIASYVAPQLLRILKMDPDHDGGYPYHILEFDRRSLSTKTA